MCVDPRMIHDPEGKLAALMSKHLCIEVDAGDLRRFLTYRWDLVSCYAHAVHEQGSRDRSPAAIGSGVDAVSGAPA